MHRNFFLEICARDAHLKEFRRGFLQVQFLRDSVKDVLCQLIHDLITGLSSPTAGQTWLYVQDGADQCMGLLCLCISICNINVVQLHTYLLSSTYTADIPRNATYILFQ